MPFIGIILIILFLSTNAFALKCNKCHKNDNSITQISQEKGIKTKQDLFNTLRKGSKAKLHQHLSDNDINEAAKQINLK